MSLVDRLLADAGAREYDDSTPFPFPVLRDSLEAVEFVIDLEEALDIDVPDEISEGWRTVGDVKAWVRDNGGAT